MPKPRCFDCADFLSSSDVEKSKIVEHSDSARNECDELFCYNCMDNVCTTCKVIKCSNCNRINDRCDECSDKLCKDCTIDCKECDMIVCSTCYERYHENHILQCDNCGNSYRERDVPNVHDTKTQILDTWGRCECTVFNRRERVKGIK
jgi:hypothetical protein